MPPWFPFALVASLLIMLGTGQKSGWRTPADFAEEERRRKAQGEPPLLVQGVLPPPPPPPRRLASEAGVRRGSWHRPGLPYRVVFEGRLFQKQTIPNLPLAVVGVYREVRGPGIMTVGANGRFAVV
jgi:hypothetical protein